MASVLQEDGKQSELHEDGSAGIYCTMSCPSSPCHISESGCCQPGEVLSCGRAVSCQLSVLAPPCREEKVVARCEMVPPLLC